jgi:hypothetical protein
MFEITLPNKYKTTEAKEILIKHSGIFLVNRKDDLLDSILKNELPSVNLYMPDNTLGEFRDHNDTVFETMKALKKEDYCLVWLICGLDADELFESISPFEKHVSESNYSAEGLVSDFIDLLHTNQNTFTLNNKNITVENLKKISSNDVLEKGLNGELKVNGCLDFYEVIYHFSNESQSNNKFNAEIFLSELKKSCKIVSF